MRSVTSAGMIVPDHHVEIYLLNGWRLSDEPCCGGARMVPPAFVCVNRVPENEKAGRDERREPAKVKITDAGYNRAGRAAQYSRR